MRQKGFSLIELLIVIAIMAILGSLALSAFSTARKQARDAQRKSDMTQYKTALESYYATYSSYPNSGTPAAIIVSNGNTGIFDTGSVFAQTYMGGSVLQGVNAADGYVYKYYSDGLSYKLWGKVEFGNYFEICANGRNGFVTAEPGGSVTCDL